MYCMEVYDIDNLVGPIRGGDRLDPFTTAMSFDYRLYYNVAGVCDGRRFCARRLTILPYDLAGPYAKMRAVQPTGVTISRFHWTRYFDPGFTLFD